ncbi:MAG: hypothetical protein ACREVT_01060 [Burkholderiales bacterium]
MMRQLRHRAAETGLTLTHLIEHALRDALTERVPEGPAYRLRWKTVRGRLRAGVDLSDRHSLIDRMEQRG